MFKRLKTKKGFTLIELIVVMAVIGVLVLLAMPKFMGYTEKARLTEIKSNIKQLENASERYYIDKQDWPRLSDTAYTSEQIDAFANEVKDRTGQVITLEPSGHYYEISFDKLQKYIQKPKDGVHYILQNPVGEVFYLEDLTPMGKSALNQDTDATNTKPVAVITMTPSTGLTTESNITWSYDSSTDADGDTIVNAEWDKALPKYTTPGNYTTRLRVQDSKGLWSEWTSVTFNIATYNTKPTAVISMTPNSSLTTSTTITWGYSNSTDYEGDRIVNAEWQGKQDVYTTAGSYTVRLRVQDSKGMWSDWVFKTFTVTELQYTYEKYSVNYISTYALVALPQYSGSQDWIYSYSGGLYSTGYTFNTQTGTITLNQPTVTNLYLDSYAVFYYSEGPGYIRKITRGTVNTSIPPDNGHPAYRITYETFQAQEISSTPAKGTYMQTIGSATDTYPHGGIKDGYWYEYKGLQ